MDDLGESIIPSTFEAVSFTLSPDLTQSQRAELAVELQFYGLLERMMPYHAQERIGVTVLRAACAVGTELVLRAAVATARALVFEMGSTTPWLNDQFQDLRYAIVDRVVNGSPVWAAEEGEWFMYRTGAGEMEISDEEDCAAGNSNGVLYNTVESPDVLAPTQLLSSKWRSAEAVTLGPQFTSAGGTEDNCWVDVPGMRVTAVHGLDDAEPAMAAALRQLAAFPRVE